MRRPLLLTALGVAALGLSIPLALLGRAVLAAPDRVELVRAYRPAGATARVRRSFFERVADGLLAADQADPFFALVREYRHAVSTPTPVMASPTPIRLATLARDISPRSERSQAHLMVGAVFALPAGNGSMSFVRMREIGGGRLLGQAAGEFREAVALDDRNEAAKYDLELVLESQGGSPAPRPSRRETKTKRPSGHNKHEGHDARHSRTRRKLHQGGVYGSGKGY